MEAFFSWVGAALGALFVVAVAVAWWEHLLRSSRPPAPPATGLPRAVSVDVQFDALPAQAAAATAPTAPAAATAPTQRGDAALRRATLDGAISRMARPGPEGGAWSETSPMVLHSAAETPDGPPDNAPDAGSTQTSGTAPTATRA